MLAGKGDLHASQGLEFALLAPSQCVDRIVHRLVAVADPCEHLLPLDPAAYRLDLPVVSTSRVPPRGARLVPDEVRELAGEVRHLMASDTAFLQRVSSVAWAERGSLVVSWTEPPVDFLLPPGAPPARLREGLGALADAASKTPDHLPTAIDLRFADQVVVRRSSDTGS